MSPQERAGMSQSESHARCRFSACSLLPDRAGMGGLANPSLQSLEIAILKDRLQVVMRILGVVSEHSGSELPADMSSEHSVVQDIHTEGSAPGVARSKFDHCSPS
jgi:hypothetical protein